LFHQTASGTLHTVKIVVGNGFGGVLIVGPVSLLSVLDACLTNSASMTVADATPRRSNQFFPPSVRHDLPPASATGLFVWCSTAGNCVRSVANSLSTAVPYRKEARSR
jgi:hypothetical protein